MRTSRVRLTRLLTSARVSARTTQAATRSSPSRRPITTTQLAPAVHRDVVAPRSSRRCRRTPGRSRRPRPRSAPRPAAEGGVRPTAPSSSGWARAGSDSSEPRRGSGMAPLWHSHPRWRWPSRDAGLSRGVRAQAGCGRDQPDRAGRHPRHRQQPAQVVRRDATPDSISAQITASPRRATPITRWPMFTGCRPAAQLRRSVVSAGSRWSRRSWQAPLGRRSRRGRRCAPTWRSASMVRWGASGPPAWIAVAVVSTPPQSCPKRLMPPGAARRGRRPPR